MTEQVQRWSIQVAAALMLALLTEASRRLASDPSLLALCWPAAGLGAAYLARWGWRGALPLLGGLLLWALMATDLSLGARLGAVLAGAAGPLVFKAVMRRGWRLARGADNPFEHNRSLGAVVTAQALVAAPLAALISGAALALQGESAGLLIAEHMASRWVLELLGFLLFAPPAWELLALRCGPMGLARELLRQGRQHAAVLLLLLGFAFAVSALWLWPDGRPVARAATYLLAPLLALSLAGMRALPAFVTLACAGLGLAAAQAQSLVSSGQQLPAEPLLISLFLGVTASAVLAVRALLNAQRRARELLEQQAFIDPNTGCLNRAGLNRLLGEWSEQVGGRDRALLSLRAGNLDAIEALAGPQSLIAMDRALADELRSELPHVRWARVSSLRFIGAVAQLEDAQADLSALERIAAGTNARLRDALHAPLWGVAGLRIPGSLPCNSSTLFSALRELEQRALASRRTVWSEADAVAQRELAASAAQAQALRARLEARDVVLVAQPLRDNLPGDARGLKLEVLCRLSGPDGSLLPPAQFLPVAVRHGLMPLLDLVVVEKTLAWFADYPAAFDQLASCALNLSGPSLADPGTAERLSTLFHRYRLDPRRFTIELTENQAISQLAQGLENLRALRALGCRIALDDFGTGLATFDYLKRFPVDVVKIDGSFVRGLETSAVDRAIVESIVRVARAMGVRTVAEFVETPRLARLVTELGVDESQGYAVGMPQRLDRLFAELLGDGEGALSSLPGSTAEGWALAGA